MQLAPRDVSKELFVSADSCDALWAGIVRQIPKDDLHLSYCRKRHKPMAFLHVRFNGLQPKWNTLKEEAFPILSTIKRIHWLTTTPVGFQLLTDDNNFMFIFDPLAFVSDLKQTSVRKVLRCAVALSAYSYVFHHLRGDENVCAGLVDGAYLSFDRWSPSQLFHAQKLQTLTGLVIHSIEAFKTLFLLPLRTSCMMVSGAPLTIAFGFLTPSPIYCYAYVLSLTVDQQVTADFTLPSYTCQRLFIGVPSSLISGTLFLCVFIAYRPPATLMFLAITGQTCSEQPQAFFCSSTISLLVRVHMVTNTHSYYVATIVVIAGSSLFLKPQLKILPLASKIVGHSLVFRLV